MKQLKIPFRKRAVSFALALLMLFSCTGTAFATGGEPADGITAVETVAAEETQGETGELPGAPPADEAPDAEQPGEKNPDEAAPTEEPTSTDQPAPTEEPTPTEEPAAEEEPPAPTTAPTPTAPPAPTTAPTPTAAPTAEPQVTALPEATATAAPLPTAEPAGPGASPEESPVPQAPLTTEEPRTAYADPGGMPQGTALRLIDLSNNGAGLDFKFRDTEGHDLDPATTHFEADGHYLLALSYKLYNPVANSALTADHVITYEFPAGLTVNDSQATEDHPGDVMNAAGTATVGQYFIHSDADGGTVLTYWYFPAFLEKQKSDISGDFTWNCTFNAEEIGEADEKNFNFGGDSSSLTIRFNRVNVTGEKTYALNADGTVRFTVTLNLPEGEHPAKNLRFSDTLGDAFRWPENASLELSAPDGNKTVYSGASLTIDGQTAKADLGDRAPGVYTLRYDVAVADAAGDPLNTADWTLDNGPDGTANTSVVLGGETTALTKADGVYNADAPSLSWTISLNGALPRKNLNGAKLTDLLTAESAGAPHQTVVPESFTVERKNAAGQWERYTGGSLTTAENAPMLYLFGNDAGTYEYRIGYRTTADNTGVPNGSYRYKNSVTLTTAAGGSISDDGAATWPVSKSATLSLAGRKTLTGRSIANNEFQVVLRDTADGSEYTASVSAGGTFAFGSGNAPRYTAAGTYRYTLSEKNTGKSGVEYDETDYTVTVEVRETADGNALQPPVVTVKQGENTVETPTFANVYRQAQATFAGKKTLLYGENSGVALTSFKVQLSELKQNTPLNLAAAQNLSGSAKTLTVKADGTIPYPTYTYTTPGTHYYKIRETDSGSELIDYDESVYYVKAEITRGEDGVLKVATSLVDAAGNPRSGSDQALDFRNEYLSAKVALGGSKTLTGGELERYFGLFHFTLAEVDSAHNAVLNSRFTSDRIAVGRSGAIDYPVLDFTAADLGENGAAATYYFEITENPGSTPGLSYDTAKYYLTVRLEKTAAGLRATPTLTEENWKPNNGSLTALNFANQYGIGSFEDGGIGIGGSKTLDFGTTLPKAWFRLKGERYPADHPAWDATDATWSRLGAWDAGARFSVQSDNSNTAALDFPDVRFEAPGLYSFLIYEEKAGQVDGNNIYYTKTAYRVTVEVADDLTPTVKSAEQGSWQDGAFTGNGRLVKSLEFHNVWRSAEIRLTATKSLAAAASSAVSAGNLNAAWNNYKSNFRFELVEVTADGTVKPGGLHQTGKAAGGANGAADNVRFDLITYRYGADEATHYYQITEQDFSVPGLTKDSAVRYAKVELTLRQGGETDSWQPVLTYYDSLADLRAGRTSGAGAVFVNTIGDDAVLRFEGTKTLAGGIYDNAWLVKYSLLDENGVVEGSIGVTANSADTAAIQFPQLRYKLADVGDHSYLIYENDGQNAENTLYNNGITQDRTAYRVTVSVANTAAGLTARVTKTEKGHGNTLADFTAEETTNGAVSLDFTNYKPVGSLALSGTKTVNGGALPADLTDWFKFSVYASDASGKKGAALQSGVGTAADGSIGFAPLSYTLQDATDASGSTEGRDYYYLITEDEGSDSRVSYDATAYRLTVHLAYDGSAQLSATVTELNKGRYAADTGFTAGEALPNPAAARLDFDNGYDTAEASVVKSALDVQPDGTIRWEAAIDLTMLDENAVINDLVYRDVLSESLKTGGVSGVAHTIELAGVTVRWNDTPLKPGDYIVTNGAEGANSFTVAVKKPLGKGTLKINYTSKTAMKFGEGAQWLEVKNNAELTYHYLGAAYSKPANEVKERFYNLVQKLAGRFEAADQSVLWAVNLNFQNGSTLPAGSYDFADTLPADSELAFVADSFAVAQGVQGVDDYAAATNRPAVIDGKTLRATLTVTEENVGKPLTVFYKTKVGAGAFSDEEKSSQSNTATLLRGNTTLGESSNKVVVSDGILNKESALVQNSVGRDFAVDYTIRVNPDKLDLLPATSVTQMLTLTDRLPTNASLVSNSFAVTTDPAGQEEAVSYTLSDDHTRLVFSLPDETAVTIRYRMLPRITAAGQEVTMENTVSLDGIYTASSKTENRFAAYQSSASASGRAKVFTITKNDSQSSGSSGFAALEGAEFTLYSVSLEEIRAGKLQDIEAGRTTGTPAEVLTTDANGVAQFGVGTEKGPLLLDQLYYYVETKSPAGYKENLTRRYFILPGSAVNATNAVTAAIAASNAGISYVNAGADSYSTEVTNDGYTASVPLEVTKLLDGELATIKQLAAQGLPADAFTFTLTDQNGRVLQNRTLNNTAHDGYAVFQNLNYSFRQAEWGDLSDGQPHTRSYQYTLTESYTDPTLVTPDRVTLDTPHSFIVTVTYDPAKTGAERFRAAITAVDDEAGAALIFKNTGYTAEVEFGIAAHKTLNGKALKGDDFRFTLTDVTTDPANTTPLKTVTNDADGNVNFGKIKFTEVGSYTYKVAEVNDGRPGVSYDPVPVRTVVITVTRGETRLEATATLDGAPLETIEYRNDYTAAGTSVRLQARKMMAGRDVQPEEFTFTLAEFTADGRTDLQTATNDADGKVMFAPIEYPYDPALYTPANGYTRVYRYRVTEEIPAPQSNAFDSGIAYDDTAYEVQVTVTDVGGKLQATTEIRHLAQPVEEMRFVNTQLQTTAKLTATKFYYGNGVLTTDRFRFTMVSANPDGTVKAGQPAAEEAEGLADNGSNPIPPQTVGLKSVSGTQGEVEFPPVRYQKAGTYYYRIAEDPKYGAAETLSQDPGAYLAAVTVERVENALTVTDIRYTWLQGDRSEELEPGQPATFFNNEFRLTRMASVSVSVPGRKILRDATDQAAETMKAGQFRFLLYDGEKIVASATNDENGDFAFRLSFRKAGVYRYTAKELNGGKTIDGVLYDAADCPVTVTVDEAMGVSIGGAVAFTNTAATEIKVTKLWQDDGQEAVRPTEIEVYLYADGDTENPLQTVTLSAETGWTHRFENLPRRDADGVIVYTVGEKPLNGYRTAISGTPAEGYLITNTYDAAGNTFFTPELHKTLVGRDDSPLTPGEFDFTLTNEAGEELATVTNDADGRVLFPMMGYTEAGTTRYTIREVKGDDAHILYDDRSITLTVTVTEQDGALTATGRYTDAADGTTLDTFTNVYRPVVLRVRKISPSSGNALAGAGYGLWMINENGGADVHVESAVSGRGGWMTFSNILLGARYYFKEETAPVGHTLNGYKGEPFRVVQNGQEGGLALAYEGETGYEVAATAVTLPPVSSLPVELVAREVSDDETELRIAKLDRNTHHFVQGATLQILEADTGRVVMEWTTGIGLQSVTGKLDVETRYLLHEAVAPEGYGLAADTAFSLDRYGNLDFCDGADAEWVGDRSLTLYDAKLTTTVTHTDYREETVWQDRIETLPRIVAYAIPQTGDQGPLGLPVLLLVGSLLGIVYLVLRKRNSR